MEKFKTEVDKDYSLLDNWTGEIKELKVTKVVDQEKFMIIFLSTLPQMFNLKGNQIKMLMYCWKYSSFNPKGETEGNIINNNVLFKDYVRNAGLNLTDSAIDVYISNLSSVGFLIKKCRGVYMLNPNYFFKGTVSDASKLQLNIIAE